MCVFILEGSSMIVRNEIGTMYSIRKKNHPYGEDTRRQIRNIRRSCQTHNKDYFHTSFVILVLSLLILIVSVVWLFQNAIAQISSFPGDTNTRLSPNTGDDQPTNATTNQTSETKMSFSECLESLGVTEDGYAQCKELMEEGEVGRLCSHAPERAEQN